MSILLAIASSPAARAAQTSVGLQALGLRPIEPTVDRDAVLPYSTATERLDPAAVMYYLATFHVSETVAYERLTVQTMVPNLTTQISEGLGTDFGALWFDNATGQWVIDVRPHGVRSAESLMSSVGLTDHYRIASSPWNHTQLMALRDDLAAHLDPTDRVGIAGDRLTVRTSPALRGGEMETIAKSRDAFARDEDLVEAPQVETQQLPGAVGPAHGSVSCGKYGNGGTSGFCNTLVAGDRWYTTAGSCTLGWWVSIKEREPREFPSILTAGHCIAPVGTVAPTKTCEPEATSCNQFGLTLTYYQGQGRGDAGLIDYYSGLYGTPTFPLASDYWNWWDSQPSPLEYYRLSPPARGTTICLQGFRTGSSCGEVTNEDTSVENTDSHLLDSNMVEVHITSGSDCRGDSGGPWDLASKDTAVGINDIIHFNEGSECGNVAWLTPIEEPVGTWGLTVWGGNGWHEPW